MNIDDLKECYIEGRKTSNDAQVTIDHKDPLVTVFSKIELKPDTKTRRPYVELPGLKSTNAITLITRSRIESRWQLVNNVLPQVKETRGINITAKICECRNGKIVTSKMMNPGSKRKSIKLEPGVSDPKVIQSQFKARTKFMKNGGLENYVKDELKLII